MNLSYSMFCMLVIYADASNLKFDVIFQWQFINFTWPSKAAYETSLQTQRYIPENVATIGMIKSHKDRIFLAFPQIRTGVPVTLGYISRKSAQKMNPLITPYPSWEMNIQEDCNTLQSVLSSEIDRNGIMWVLDGVRLNNNTMCPTKLVLLDLEDNGNIVFTKTFTDSISASAGGFLNDIVLDETADDTFAYITESSSIDPGLIVFSRKTDKVWKLRDESMFAEISQDGFVVNNRPFNLLNPINGIALSPRNTNEKNIYYSCLTGIKLHSLAAEIARNYSAYASGEWRRSIRYIGDKQSQGDGMVMDNMGNLYYGLVPLYGVGKWNTHEPFSSSKIVAQDRQQMIWVDAFTFDNNGHLLMVSDNANLYLDSSVHLEITDQVLFRVFQAPTPGAKSYLYK